MVKTFSRLRLMSRCPAPCSFWRLDAIANIWLDDEETHGTIAVCRRRLKHGLSTMSWPDPRSPNREDAYPFLEQPKSHDDIFYQRCLRTASTQRAIEIEKLLRFPTSLGFPGVPWGSRMSSNFPVLPCIPLGRWGMNIFFGGFRGDFHGNFRGTWVASLEISNDMQGKPSTDETQKNSLLVKEDAWYCAHFTNRTEYICFSIRIIMQILNMSWWYTIKICTYVYIYI